MRRRFHPQYIIGETKDEYASLGVTHSTTSGKRHRTHLLKKNPNPNDSKPSYMKKNIEISNKKNYMKSKKYSHYRLSEEDEKYVDDRISNYLNKKNKK